MTKKLKIYKNKFGEEIVSYRIRPNLRLKMFWMARKNAFWWDSISDPRGNKCVQLDHFLKDRDFNLCSLSCFNILKYFLSTKEISPEDYLVMLIWLKTNDID